MSSTNGLPEEYVKEKRMTYPEGKTLYVCVLIALLLVLMPADRFKNRGDFCKHFNGPDLCRFEANWVVMMRPLPWWPMTRCMSASRTVVSLRVRPGDNTFVESLMNSATPSLPAPDTEVRTVTEAQTEACERCLACLVACLGQALPAEGLVGRTVTG